MHKIILTLFILTTIGCGDNIEKTYVTQPLETNNVLTLQVICYKGTERVIYSKLDCTNGCGFAAKTNKQPDVCTITPLKPEEVL